MAIAPNRYANDPALGQAFANLASIFAPPSGQDVAAYAVANSKNAEAARLAELFSYARDPNFDQTTFDRLGVGAGAFPPNQSYYAVDQGNLTSRSNNAADNARALQAQQMADDAALARQYALPITVGENQTVALPGQTAAATGLPALFGGQTSIARDETIITPDGRTMTGQTTPLTDEQVKGAVLQGLTPGEQRAVAIGNTPVETIMGNDGQPQISYRADAVGRQPAPAALTNIETTNYQSPDGKQGTAYFDVNSKEFKDTSSQQPIPQGSTMFRSSLEGGTAETGLGPTTANITTAGNAEAVYNALDADTAYLRGMLANKPGIAGIVGKTRGLAQNIGASIGEVLSATGRDVSPNTAVALEDVQEAARRIAPNFDPAIAEFNLGMANLAYRLAQMNNPSGEISRQAYERSLASLEGGMLANNQSVDAALQGVQKQTQRNRENYLATLRNPGGQSPAAPATAAPAPAPAENAGPQPGHVEDGYRFKGGDPADPANWEPV